MDSHHPHQDGRVFTFVCGYMLFHKPTVVEMLAHITSHLSGKEARHSPPALVPPAAASSEVATASPKGTSAKAAAKVAKVEPAVTEAQRKVAEKATEATEAVSQPPKGGVAAEPAADATPTAAELAQAAQAAEVEDAGDDERGGGLESESGELMDDEEEVAMEVEPEVRPRRLERAKGPAWRLLCAASVSYRCASVRSGSMLTGVRGTSRWYCCPNRA
jgi:hypothetical protein